MSNSTSSNFLLGAPPAKRSDYLEKIWKRYPEMPRGVLRYGRIEKYRLGVQVLSDWFMYDSPELKVTEVLIDGDLVAIMPQNRLLLLAPNLVGRSPRSEKWSRQKQYFDYLSLVRQFFSEKRFQEVKTSTLVACPGTEPTLEVFETEFFNGNKTHKYYLPTSPELNLKKLLSEGAERIYEIASVFRNSEYTERHRPEFTMLEWYRAFNNLQSIKMDTIELVEFLCEKLKIERPLEILTFSIAELFKKHCQFEFSPRTTIGELQSLAQKLNVDVASAESIDDYFYLIFMDKIENQLPSDRLVFVEKYPPYQAALARISTDGWAERFEVYWHGLELGNAFHELNDPEIQRLRSQEDLQKKAKAGHRPISLDEEFFSALEFGLPPSAGIAVGLERLFMALYKLKNIDFPR